MIFHKYRSTSYFRLAVFAVVVLFISTIALTAHSTTITRGIEPNNWNEVSVDPPRFNYGCVAVPGIDDIYCMGGMAVGDGWMNPVAYNYSYNTQTEAWQQRASIPDPISAPIPHLTYLDGKIYLISNPGLFMQGSLKYFIYDIAEDTWIDPDETEELDAYLIGPNRMRPIAVSSYDGAIYLLHEYREGMDGDTQRQLRLSMFDPSEGVWTNEVHAMDVSAAQIREGVSYVSIGSQIYMFAGADALGNFSRSTLVYDVADNTFTTRADMPTYRQDGMATIGPDGKIYIFGGVPIPEELQLGVKTETVVSYDPEGDAWSSELPLSRMDSHGDAVLGADGEMYVFMTESSEEQLPPIHERPILEYYIDQSYDTSWDMDHDKGIYKAYAPSLATALCPPVFQRCNYHVTPGTQNTSFQLSPVLVDGQLVATPDEFSMANMAFLAPVGDTTERIVLRFAPNVTISGSVDWDGVFLFPEFLPEVSVTPDGDDVEVERVIKLGGNVSLALSDPARLVIPGGGEEGYRVGYVEPGSDEFVEITTECAEDSLTSASSQLSAGEACKMIVEEPDDIAPEFLEPKRLVVWTTHFTEFATYTTAQDRAAMATALTPQDLVGAPDTGFAPRTIAPVVVLLAIGGSLLVVARYKDRRRITETG